MYGVYAVLEKQIGKCLLLDRLLVSMTDIGPWSTSERALQLSLSSPPPPVPNTVTSCLEAVCSSPMQRELSGKAFILVVEYMLYMQKVPCSILSILGKHPCLISWTASSQYWARWTNGLVQYKAPSPVPSYTPHPFIPPRRPWSGSSSEAHLPSSAATANDLDAELLGREDLITCGLLVAHNVCSFVSVFRCTSTEFHCQPDSTVPCSTTV